MRASSNITNDCDAVDEVRKGLYSLYQTINTLIVSFDGQACETFRLMHELLIEHCPSYKKFGLGIHCHLSSLAILFNKETGQHKDERCIPSGFDVIVGAGRYSGGDIDLRTLNMTVPLERGDILIIRGALIDHGTQRWEGLGRISLVFFVHKEVLDQLRIPRVSPFWGSERQANHMKFIGPLPPPILD